MDQKVLEYDDKMMLVEVSFVKDQVNKLHHHEHVQFVYVLEGRFKFTTGDEKRIIARGDTVHVPSEVEHGVVCLEKGALLNVFSPMRKDYV